LPEGAQCPPSRYILKASERNIGKRKKQAEHQERIDEQYLKRGGAALIREESVTPGVTPTLKTFGSERLAKA